MAIGNLIALLDNPYVKAGMVALGTFLVRRWPKFVNEAAPIWTLISSVVLTILHTLFPASTRLGDQPSMLFGHSDMVLTGIFSSGGFFWAFLRDALLPWLVGFGAQRAGDQTVVWAAGKSPA